MGWPRKAGAEMLHHYLNSHLSMPPPHPMPALVLPPNVYSPNPAPAHTAPLNKAEGPPV